MADDIDIEEHDILDNPRIQDILHIKEEPIDIGDQYEEPAVSHEEYNQCDYYHEDDHGHIDDQLPQYDQEPPDNPPDYYQEPPDDTSDFDQDLSEHIQQPNELQPPDSEFSDHEDFILKNTDSTKTIEHSYQPDLSNEIYHHNNKIILGTKPCRRPKRDVNAAYVSLEDWGVRLQNSNCYCNDCQTLFATRNALDAHNMIAHSFLVALDSPESSESDTALQEKSETAKYCDHCKKYFPNDHALIQHLYDLITANKQTNVTETTPKDNKDTNPKLQIASNSAPVMFSCLDCGCSYVDEAWARTHTINVHNKTDSLEHVPFKGICKFCTFTSSRVKKFNWHVKEMHLGIKPRTEKGMARRDILANVRSNLKLRNGETKSPNSTDNQKCGIEYKKAKNFKCVKCKTFFSSRKSIGCHQKRFHEGEDVIRECVPRKVVSEVQNLPAKVSNLPAKVSNSPAKVLPLPAKVSNLPVNVSSEVKSKPKIEFADRLVPKNSVFKCNDCDIHFVTCWSAILHTCVPISRYDCDVCSKQFPLKDSKIHINQHKYNDAFNTYYISKNMNTKMLFWCQKCAVYFELRKIQNHITKCTGTSSSVRCKLCEIDVNDVLTHMNSHQLHPTKSDFIFIDDLLPNEGETEELPRFSTATPEKSLKRKLPMESEPWSSKTKKIESNQFYYCTECQTCLRTTSKCHLNGDCKNITAKKNCEYCGLIFLSTDVVSHENYHKKSNCQLKAFGFINIADDTPIVPLIPEFPRCQSCDVHDFASHQCGPFKSCKTCNKKFSHPVYDLHLLHHKHLRVDSDVTELIKKYETLSPIWNILYLCRACKVATDSYDDVVQHCQNHYNNIKDGVRCCNICLVKLEETCYKRHMELHSQSVTKASFKTVMYDYKNLQVTNDEVWLKLFHTLTEAEKQQIVTRTIYVTRLVRMRLILNGPPELTIYKCETCKRYVDPNSIYMHTANCVTLQDCNKKSYRCEICLIPFSTTTARKEHELLHSKPNISANSFRIVAFNHKSDRQFNSNLRLSNLWNLKTEGLESKPTTSINVRPADIIEPNLKSVVVYHCKQCDCSSHNAESLIRHKCATKKELVKCRICQMHIHIKNYKKHRKWHRQYPQITKENLSVLAIDNNTLKRKHEPKCKRTGIAMHKLHRCKKCKTCFTYWVKHATCIKNQRECQKCGYSFSRWNYELHKLWHKMNMNATKADIKVVTLSSEETPLHKLEKRMFLRSLNIDNVVNIRKALRGKSESKTTLYQCYNCERTSYALLFIKRHTSCVHYKNVTCCKICGLKFSRPSMIIHKKWHNDNPKATIEQFKILQFKGTTLLKGKDENTSDIVSSNGVHRCKSCGAASKKSIFLNKHKCSYRASTQEQTAKTAWTYYQCQKCKICSVTTQHNCIPAHRTSECPHCKLKFTYKNIYVHMQQHLANKNMTRSKITVIPFNERVVPKPDLNKPVDKVSVVFKCSCGLHFNSQKTIERHFTVCSPDHDIPSENCSKCGLLFPTNHLVSHLCSHHSYGKGNIEIKTIPTVTYYRCGNCKCVFIDKSRVLNHIKRCDVAKVRSARCDDCELYFHNSEMRLHKEQHKITDDSTKPRRILTINNKDGKRKQTEVEVVTPNKKKTESVISSSDKVKLLKCHICDVHYLTGLALRNHYVGKHDVAKHYCPECKIPFSLKGLDFHLRVHHERMKLKLENFNIVERPEYVKFGSKPDKIKEKSASPVLVKEKLSTTQDDIERSLDTTIESTECPIIYNCVKCNVHFTSTRSMDNHFENNHRMDSVETCNFCGLTFLSLSNHKKHHHPSAPGVLQILDVNDESESVNKLFRCQCGVHFMKPLNLIAHIVKFPSNHIIDMHYTKTCSECGLPFTWRSLKSHQLMHHKKNFFSLQDLVIDTSMGKYRTLKFSSDDDMLPQSSEEVTDVNNSTEKADEEISETNVSSTNKSQSTSTKLYKCGKCNVYFLTQATCYKHTVKHIPMDPREYIECKLCSFQFKIISLNTHIRKHHKTDFEFENVLIEEYQPKADDEKAPKIDIYYAKDKVQSRLISTTTEDSVDNSVSQSEIELANDIDVSIHSKETVIISNTGVNTVINESENVTDSTSLNCSLESEVSNDSKDSLVMINSDDVTSKTIISAETDKAINVDSENKTDLSSIALESEASADSKDILIITNSVNVTEPTTKTHVDVIVRIPSLTCDLNASTDSKETPELVIKEEPDTITNVNLSSTVMDEETASCKVVDSEEIVKKTNESKIIDETPQKEGESSKIIYPCALCSETFASRRAKEFHENLDHLDTIKECPVCKKSLHASLLNLMHLHIKNGFFTCCVCQNKASIDLMQHHAYLHQHML